MNRPDAASLLGVGPDATPSQVRAAFRSQVRSAHPDLHGDQAADLDALTRARDVLLAGPATSAPQVPTPERIAPRVVVPAAPASRRRGARVLLGVIVSLFALALVAVVVVIVLAIAVGTDTDDPATADTECLVVSADGVQPSSCSAAQAQRVIAEFSGVRTCPSGANALTVGATTWCLEPVNSQ